MNITKQSRFLSFILRHKPEKIGLVLDHNGWANVKELLKKTDMDIETLEEIVLTNNKKRFAFNENKTKIRASQGHSINVDLQLESKEPPEILYHGTATRFLNSIYDTGLVSKNRIHVHLSSNKEIATKVGQRHGKVIILEILSGRMFKDGYKFYISDNEVWLTNNVPTKYLRII